MMRVSAGRKEKEKTPPPPRTDEKNFHNIRTQAHDRHMNALDAI